MYMDERFASFYNEVNQKKEENPMKRKKIVSFLLTMALVGSMTACGNSADSGEKYSSNGSSSDGTQQSDSTQEASDSAQNVQEKKDIYGYDEPVSIKIGLSYGADFTYQEGESATENKWMNLYREHNIVPEILYEVDNTQAETKLSTAIMSGNYPDILCASTTDFVNYAQTDVVADITDVFEEYASDELKEYLNTDGGLALSYVTIDGKMYGLPKMGSSYDSVPVMFIRQDWLDNLGLSIPTTMDELKKIAHAFTYEDPDKNGADDTYGLAIDGMNILSWSVGDATAIFDGYGAYPGTDGMAFVEYEPGKVTWGGTNADGMKAGLQLLQDMYADGSLAKDFITMDSDAIFEEAGAGRCGIWFGPMWGGMVPSSSLAKENPDAHIVSAPIPNGLGQGESKELLKPSIDGVYCVSSKCENPEVLIKLMNLSVQKLCYPESEEEFYKYYGTDSAAGWKCAITQTLTPLKNYDNYKLESAALSSGDTSQLNAEQSGDYSKMKKYLDSKGTDAFDPEDPEISTGISLYTVFGDPQGSYAALDEMIRNDRFVYSAYNFLPSDSMAENASTLKKLTVETIAKIITGESVDSYDTFLETWYTLGGQDVIDDAQAWADAN